MLPVSEGFRGWGENNDDLFVHFWDCDFTFVTSLNSKMPLEPDYHHHFFHKLFIPTSVLGELPIGGELHWHGL